MAIYARKNLIINPSGPSSLLTQPLTNGAIMVFDASLGSFVNQSTDQIITAVSLGTGEDVYVNRVGNQLQFESLIPGTNITLTHTADGILVSATAGSGSAAATIVPDIASRDALTGLSAGSQVFVTTDLNGESAMYMWSGTAYVKLSTANSADSDAKTYTGTINSGQSTITLGNISEGGRVDLVSIRVLVPFNGSTPTLTVGSDLDGATVIMDASMNDLTQVGEYLGESTFVFPHVLDTPMKVYLNDGGSTLGQAIISVTFA